MLCLLYLTQGVLFVVDDTGCCVCYKMTQGVVFVVMFVVDDTGCCVCCI